MNALVTKVFVEQPRSAKNLRLYFTTIFSQTKPIFAKHTGCFQEENKSFVPLIVVQKGVFFPRRLSQAHRNLRPIQNGLSELHTLEMFPIK